MGGRRRSAPLRGRARAGTQTPGSDALAGDLPLRTPTRTHAVVINCEVSWTPSLETTRPKRNAERFPARPLVRAPSETRPAGAPETVPLPAAPPKTRGPRSQGFPESIHFHPYHF